MYRCATFKFEYTLILWKVRSTMSNRSGEEKDHIEINHRKRSSKSIVDVVRSSNLSEHARPDRVRTKPLRKIRSENEIESGTNYDDLCGPWIYPRNPFYSRYHEPPCPRLCVWKYFTMEDLCYLKKYQEDENAIRSFFEYKFLDKQAGGHNILVKLLWKSFRFARLHLFTEKSISACLGILYLTHAYFLSYPWWTAEDVYRFFYKTILLHVSMYPPRSLEVFTVNECKLMFELFHKMFLENLVLLHVLCHPNYHFVLRLRNSKEN